MIIDIFFGVLIITGLICFLYPSSQVCSKCGWINQNLKLSDRKWKCAECETEHDRDKNAAKNILAQVQRELNLKGCRNGNLKPVELSSVDEAVKQEAIGSLAR